MKQDSVGHGGVVEYRVMQAVLTQQVNKPRSCRITDTFQIFKGTPNNLWWVFITLKASQCPEGKQWRTPACTGFYVLRCYSSWISMLCIQSKTNSLLTIKILPSFQDCSPQGVIRIPVFSTMTQLSSTWKEQLRGFLVSQAKLSPKRVKEVSEKRCLRLVFMLDLKRAISSKVWISFFIKFGKPMLQPLCSLSAEQS